MQKDSQQAGENDRTVFARTPTRKADLLAVVAGAVVTTTGFAQLFLPAASGSLTGFEPGVASSIVGALWLTLGLLLVVGGAARLRAVALNAAFSLIVTSACSIVVILWKAPGTAPLVVHSAMAVLGIFGGVILHITDRSDLKKELMHMRWLSTGQHSSDGDA